MHFWKTTGFIYQNRYIPKSLNKNFIVINIFKFYHECIKSMHQLQVFGDIAIPGMDKDIKRALEKGSKGLEKLGADDVNKVRNISIFVSVI